MHPDSVQEILEATRPHLANSVEITLEANPGTITKEKLAAFQAAGINRISLGVQSFDDKNLKRFGRIHTGAEAKSAIHNIASLYENFSFDLIFGFPDQTFEEWQKDLDIVTEFSPKHVSCYALTAEPHTEYTYKLKKGVYAEATPKLFDRMQAYTYERLRLAGLDPYEVSNFAKPGFESQHNLGYWRYRSYFGLGAGATTNLRVGRDPVLAKRFSNLRRPEEYMQAIESHKPSYPSEEQIDLPTAEFEFLMMGLRLEQGIDLEDYQSLFGQNFLDRHKTVIEEQVRQGRLKMLNNVPHVTDVGYLQNNPLVVAFSDGATGD